MEREKLISIIKKDGTAALAMAQGSSLKQIEEAANTRFAAVNDLYIYLRDQKIWTVKMKADSIYKCVRCNKFTGRNWRVLTPSFDDIVSFQTFNIEGQDIEACLVIGVARAERALAARISKEKSKLQAVYETITGYSNYNPEPPSEQPTKPDYVDAEFTEIPVPTLPAPSEQAKPAPSEQAKPAPSEQAKPAPSEQAKPAPEAKPLYLEVGLVNSDRSALEAILGALAKTTSASNKKDLLAFRLEVRQALISVGLLEDK